MIWNSIILLVLFIGASAFITDANQLKKLAVLFGVLFCLNLWINYANNEEIAFEKKPLMILDENGGVPIRLLDSTEIINAPVAPIKTVANCHDIDLSIFMDRTSPPRSRLFQINTAIACYAKLHEVEPIYFLALIAAESAFNHRAVSRSADGSYVGALGITQVMPATASINCTSQTIPEKYRAIKRGSSIDEQDFLNNPHKQLYCGSLYFSKRFHELKDKNYSVYEFVDTAIIPRGYALTMCAYNAGLHRVNKLNGCPNFKETRGYVFSIQRNVANYKALGSRMPAYSALGLGDN
jgi:hypothetical protein